MKFINATGNEYTPENFLSYDDVMLSPKYSELISRNDERISLRSSLTPLTQIDIPIIPASMDTVCGVQMHNTLVHNFNSGGILHRNYKDDHLRLQAILSMRGIPAFSVGIADKEIDFIDRVLDYVSVIPIVNVDIAHANQLKAIEFIGKLRKIFGGAIEIIGGSICTVNGASRLINAGVDTVRVGIGNGHACTTRIMTGHGIPQLTAIINIREAFPHLNIIADGGIRNSGDIVKALAAGANTVMVGHVFAGTSEAPGPFFYKDGEKYYQCQEPDDFYRSETLYRKYRGQSSQDYLNDNGRFDVSPEGVHYFIEDKGSVVPIIETLLGGIRSGMTYSGVSTLEELFSESTFIEISRNGFIESSPHGIL